MDYEYLNKYRLLKAEYEAIIKYSKDRRQVAQVRLQLKKLNRNHKKLVCSLP